MTRFVPRLYLAPLAAAGIALASAFFLKDWFKTASPQELLWILSPLAHLVSLLSGHVFTFLPAYGFISVETKTIIAPACSGINFLLMCFCMLSLQGQLHLRRWLSCLNWLLYSAAFSYLATLAINGMRIVFSMWLFQHKIEYGFITMDRLHRICGIVLYYPALLLIFSGAAILLRRVQKRQVKGHAWAIAIVPLFCYITGTVLVPFIRQKYYSALFWEHSFSVAILAGGLSTIIWLKLHYTRKN